MNDMRKIDVLKNAFKANNIKHEVIERVDGFGTVLLVKSESTSYTEVSGDVVFYFDNDGNFERVLVE